MYPNCIPGIIILAQAVLNTVIRLDKEHTFSTPSCNRVGGNLLLTLVIHHFVPTLKGLKYAEIVLVDIQRTICLYMFYDQTFKDYWKDICMILINDIEQSLNVECCQDAFKERKKSGSLTKGSSVTENDISGVSIWGLVWRWLGNGENEKPSSSGWRPFLAFTLNISSSSFKWVNMCNQ